MSLKKYMNYRCLKTVYPKNKLDESKSISSKLD